MSARKLILLTVFTLAALLAQAQSNLPKTTVAGHEFYYYDTSAGESIYGIAAKLGITKDEIIKNNPDAADGITSGMRLYFPAEVEDANTVTSNVTELKTQNSALQHDVKQGETLYGLAKTYGTTVDELIALNPGSENGIKIGQKLMIPSSRTNEQISVNADKQVHDAFSQNAPLAAQAGSDATFLTINDGEDIYSIAKQYNASVESILTNNPGLNPDEYVTGTKIKVVPNTALPFNYERMSRRNYKYEVQRGETYASIAKANGITEEELKTANPDLKKVKKGKTITLPKPYTEQVIGEMATIPVDELRAYYQPRINDLYESLVQKRLDSEVNIALVLPFQLHKSAPPKQAYRYTDFYKGFLLALDDAAKDCPKHFNLKVYDTQHNLNVTDSILSLPELKTMNFIIAPSEPQQLSRINTFGKTNGVPVLNCFTTKNEDYLDNPYVYQVNTPTNELMHNVMRWFDEQFKGYNVIFLNAASENDKEMFEHIRNHITRKKYNTTTINVNGDLTYDDISNKMNPGSKYVFIPSSGDKNLIKRFVKALKEVKSERFDCDLSLIAYPEYVLYLKDYQTDLQDIDSYMFSRFFNAKGYRTRDLDAAYKANYEGEPLKGEPYMALYGWDTGMYLLKSLGVDGRIDEETPLYEGVQTSFRWERGDNWRGFTNQAVEIVHFSTDHQITVNVK
jgi:LysM repeat protein